MNESIGHTEPTVVTSLTIMDLPADNPLQGPSTVIRARAELLIPPGNPGLPPFATR
jgi:hypothetical protein